MKVPSSPQRCGLFCEDEGDRASGAFGCGGCQCTGRDTCGPVSAFKWTRRPVTGHGVPSRESFWRLDGNSHAGAEQLRYFRGAQTSRRYQGRSLQGRRMRLLRNRGHERVIDPWHNWPRQIIHEKPMISQKYLPSCSLSVDHSTARNLGDFVTHRAHDEGPFRSPTWHASLPETSCGKQKPFFITRGNMKRILPPVAGYVKLKGGAS